MANHVKAKLKNIGQVFGPYSGVGMKRVEVYQMMRPIVLFLVIMKSVTGIIFRVVSHDHQWDEFDFSDLNLSHKLSLFLCVFSKGWLLPFRQCCCIIKISVYIIIHHLNTTIINYVKYLPPSLICSTSQSQRPL